MTCWVGLRLTQPEEKGEAWIEEERPVSSGEAAADQQPEQTPDAQVKRGVSLGKIEPDQKKRREHEARQRAMHC